MAEDPPSAGEDDDGAGGGPVIATSSAFALLEPEWAALHAEAPGSSPFLHPTWHATWLRHFGAGSEPLFLAFREAERLVGVATLDLAGTEPRELGDPDVRDFAGPLVVPGYEDAVADTLLEWLAEDMAAGVALWGIRDSSPLRPALEAAADLHGWTLAEAVEATSPALPLPPTWNGYLAALPKHDRHELRRKLRRLDAAGVVSYTAAAAAAETAQTLETLLAQMRESHPGKQEFLTPAREAFFRDLAATFAPSGMARLGALSLDGTVIATLFTFEDSTTVYLYNSGYDPAAITLSAGLLSKALAIKDAIERGKERFEFLRGDEDYKRHLGGDASHVLRMQLRR